MILQGMILGGEGIPNPLTVPLVITPALPNVTPLTINQSLTGSGANAALSITPTWNTSGNPSAINVDVTDTASGATARLMDLKVGGSSLFYVTKAGLVVSNDNAGYAFSGNAATKIFRDTGGGSIRFQIGGTDAAYLTASGIGLFSSAGSIAFGGSADVVIRRDGAGILSQRNGANAQTFRVANTDDGSGNFERGFLRWASNQFEVGVEAGGTGLQRDINIRSGSTATIQLMNGANVRWIMNSSGHFICNSDNTFDIGASGANRPRNLYMASWIRFAVTVVGSLPAAGTAGQGARMLVTDANATTFQSIVAGGGANIVPVYSDGTNWRIG